MLSQIETIENNTLRVCKRLKSMAALKFGEKWSTTSGSPQKNTVLTAILRTLWYWNDSIDMSIADFNSTLEEAFTLVWECIDKYSQYSEEQQNSLTRCIVQLISDTSNVKLAMIRHKGTYMNNDGVKTAVDDIITHINDTTNEIFKSIMDAGIKSKIDNDYKSRKNNQKNPLIVQTADSGIKPSTPIAIDKNNANQNNANQNNDSDSEHDDQKDDHKDQRIEQHIDHKNNDKKEYDSDEVF